MSSQPEVPGWTPDWGTMIAGTALASLLTSGAATALEATTDWHTNGLHLVVDTRNTRIVDDNTIQRQTEYGIQTPVGTTSEVLTDRSPYSGTVRLQMPNVAGPGSTPKTNSTNNEQLSQLTDSAASFIKEHEGDKQMLHVTITGMASDEWTSNPNNGGVGVPDIGNEQVAENYATTAKNAIISSLHEQGIELPAGDIEIQAKEVILDATQQQSLLDVTKSLGFKSVADLLRAYDANPDIGNSDQHAILNSLIVDNRGAEVTIDDEATSTQKWTATIYRLDEGCLLATDAYAHTQKGGGKYPLVICFVPFPWMRRRNYRDESRRQSRLDSLADRAAEVRFSDMPVASDIAWLDSRTRRQYVARHFSVITREGNLPLGAGGGIGGGGESKVRADNVPPIGIPESVQIPQYVAKPELAPASPTVSVESEVPQIEDETQEPEAKTKRDRNWHLRWVIPAGTLITAGALTLSLHGCDSDKAPTTHPTTGSAVPGNVAPIPTGPICDITTTHHLDGKIVSTVTIPGAPKVGNETTVGPYTPAS